MRRYESIFITSTNASEDVVMALVDKIKAQIVRSDGEVVDFQKWGDRQLAYEIRRQRRGRYYRIDFVAETNLAELIPKLEEIYRISEEVIRWMTVRTHIDTTLDEAKAEVAEAAANRPAEKSTETAEADKGSTESAKAATEKAATEKAPEETKPAVG